MLTSNTSHQFVIASAAKQSLLSKQRDCFIAIALQNDDTGVEYLQ